MSDAPWTTKEITLAKHRCWYYCQRGDYLDLENGVVSICKTADDCEGWVPYLTKIRREITYE